MAVGRMRITIGGSDVHQEGEPRRTIAEAPFVLFFLAYGDAKIHRSAREEHSWVTEPSINIL